MHISDGILAPEYCAAGYAVAAAVTGLALAKVKQDDVPKVAVMSAVFFVSSLIHFRIGPTSVHLVLLGLTGILLGRHAPLAILAGLLFQAVMFGHGGITTLGVNTAMLSIPALLVHYTYRALRKLTHRPILSSIAAGVLAALAVFAGAGLVLLVVGLSEKEFAGIAVLLSVSHGVLAVAEGIVTGAVVHTLLKVKPGMVAV